MTRRRPRPEDIREAMRRMGISVTGPDGEPISVADILDLDADDDELEWDEDWLDIADPAEAADGFLMQALDYRTVPQLRAIARGFGWPLKGQLRDDILDQMANHYRDPVKIEQALASLSTPDQQRLALLTYAGLTSRQSAERQARLFAERLAGRQPGVSCTPRDLDELVARGLVFQLGDDPRAQFTVVPSFVPLLPTSPLLAPPKDVAGLRPDPPAEPLAMLLAAWQVVAEDAPVTAVDPFEAGSYQGGSRWRTLPAEDAATTKAHRALRVPSAPGPYPEPLRAAMRAAAGLDEPGLGSFLGAILSSLQLVTFDGQQLHVAPADRQALLMLDAVGLRLGLLSAWLEIPYGLWDEFTAARLRGEPLRLYRRQGWYFTPSELDEATDALRNAAIIAARWLPAERGVADGWVSLPDLDALLQAAYPTVVAPGGKSAAWYLAVAPGKPLDGAQLPDWQLGHAAIWHLIFSGPLRWLGLVETASDARGELAALRLSPAGAAILHGTPLPVAPGAGVTWGEELDVTVTPGTASGGLLGTLLQLAEPTHLPDGRLHFRFTPVAAQQAFQAGAVPADVHARLVEAGAPPPTAVAEALAQWFDSWGTTHRYDDLALLEVADETLLAELLARPGVAEHGVFRCGPTTLALDPSAVDKVVAQLRRWGYLAKVVDA